MTLSRVDVELINSEYSTCCAAAGGFCFAKQTDPPHDHDTHGLQANKNADVFYFKTVFVLLVNIKLSQSSFLSYITSGVDRIRMDIEHTKKNTTALCITLYTVLMGHV